MCVSSGAYDIGQPTLEAMALDPGVAEVLIQEVTMAMVLFEVSLAIWITLYSNRVRNNAWHALSECSATLVRASCA